MNLAFVWPFTGPETVVVLGQVGAIIVAIIAAIKATEAKQAVNGHLLKLQNEQDRGKREREAEFDKLLQVVKEASRAEGEEAARKAAELLAARVAEEVARERGRSSPPSPSVSAPAPAPVPAPAAAHDSPTGSLENAIVDLTKAAQETVDAAEDTVEKTVVFTAKHPKK